MAPTNLYHQSRPECKVYDHHTTKASNDVWGPISRYGRYLLRPHLPLARQRIFMLSIAGAYRLEGSLVYTKTKMGLNGNTPSASRLQNSWDYGREERRLYCGIVSSRWVLQPSRPSWVKHVFLWHRQVRCLTAVIATIAKQLRSFACAES
ncbi:uncharacterized protein BDW43DRAFT_289699 [Aspergillus alliaceus]|uniref:uncharacterized protein n=1 Tax=Petromyces alliaceus TaxID=209559 RepID=UPI0012A4B4AE|nr:uncharacterized protein BDW43DRAFT_289699 [Aspergillus alliaceus]KAB8229045.1 hypothetical protein BDW43DRAFT_289699 [Aspergillus alliaceus]